MVLLFNSIKIKITYFFFNFRCDAKSFNLSKSQKKVLKKMNNFLRTGQRSADNCPMDAIESNPAENNEVNAVQYNQNESCALAESILITSNEPKNQIDVNSMINIIKNSSNTTNGPVESIANQSNDVECPIEAKQLSGPDPTKPLCKKAKLLRQQRKLEKQMMKSNLPADSKVDTMPWKKTVKHTEHTLQSLIKSMPTDGKHKLEVIRF